MYWWCTDDALIICWWCTNDWLTMHWWGTCIWCICQWCTCIWYLILDTGPWSMYVWCMYICIMYPYDDMHLWFLILDLDAYMHVSTMHIYLIFDPDACVYDAYIFDPWPCCILLWCLCVWCIYLWSLTLIMMDISMILDPWPGCIYASIHDAYIYMTLNPDACMYDAVMNDAYVSKIL